MKHRHYKPVFGCPDCIANRGKLSTSMEAYNNMIILKLNDVKELVTSLNNSAIPDSQYETYLRLLDGIDDVKDMIRGNQ